MSPANSTKSARYDPCPVKSMGEKNYRTAAAVRRYPEKTEEVLSELPLAIIFIVISPETQLRDVGLGKLLPKPTVPGNAGIVSLSWKQRQNLYYLLTTRFNVEELHELCFLLGIPDDELPKQSATKKTRELIGYLERRNRIQDLIDLGSELRPDAPWML